MRSSIVSTTSATARYSRMPLQTRMILRTWETNTHVVDHMSLRTQQLSMNHCRKKNFFINSFLRIKRKWPLIRHREDLLLCGDCMWVCVSLSARVCVHSLVMLHLVILWGASLSKKKKNEASDWMWSATSHGQCDSGYRQIFISDSRTHSVDECAQYTQTHILGYDRGKSFEPGD